MEEYKYVSKGYEMEIEGGLDPKQGYYFEDMETFRTEHSTWFRATSFKILVRERGNKPAAIMMILERSDTEYVDYFCIPLYNSEQDVWDAAYEDFIHELTFDWGLRANSKDYSWGMVSMISYLFEND